MITFWKQLRRVLLIIYIAQSQMAYAAARLQSATVTMDSQRESFDASTEKLMENLVKISQIQQNIGRLNAENITLVSPDNTFRLHGRWL
jgi:hypothetical protein